MILGFDTATPDTAVAVVDGERLICEARRGPDPDGRFAHGRALLPMVDGAVAEAGGWAAIGRIAVGAGPGSFTGLRIGFAVAQGLAQARGLPLVAVPSTAALLAALAERPEAAGRPLLALIDARRGEVFAARAEPGAGSEGAGPPLVCAPDGLRAAPELGLRAGESPLAAGDGALRFRSEIEADGIEVLPDRDPAHRISARSVARLGADVEPGSEQPIRPIYLRRPDAERWLERNRSN